MGLVIKSWRASTDAKAGEANVLIVARESGLLSYVLSVLGIDATVRLQVTARHLFFEVGSLAGFNRLFVPLEHVCSTYYGRFKPWKATVAMIFISVALGLFIIMSANSAGPIMFGTVILFGGIAVALLYYFLNKQLSIGFTSVDGQSRGLVFKRSVLEGQEIDEKATESVILIIEHLIKPTSGIALERISLSGNAPAVSATPSGGTRPRSTCPKCSGSISAADIFCGGCGC